MKLNVKLKSLITDAVFISLLSLTVVGCSNNPEKQDSKEVAEDHNEAKFDDTNREKDAQFLVNAAGMSLKEIQLSQLAQSSGVMIDIRDVAKKMESDHNKNLNELNRLAEQKQISLPATTPENAQDAFKNLSNKTGKNFDEEYSDMLVKDHKEAIALFEKASNECNDAEIREWARTTLPILRTHLDHAITIQDKVNNVAEYK